MLFFTVLKRCSLPQSSYDFVAEKDFEICFAWVFLENLFINISDWHICYPEQIWFILAQKCVVNKFEESCLIHIIIFCTASNNWLHEEFFCFLPNCGIIPSIKLLCIFLQKHVLEVLSKTPEYPLNHFFNIKGFLFVFTSLILGNMENDFLGFKTFDSLWKLFEILNIAVRLVHNLRIRIISGNFWNKTVVSNETRCFNRLLWWVWWVLNNFLDLNFGCWDLLNWCSLLLWNFTFHSRTSWRHNFLLMN